VGDPTVKRFFSIHFTLPFIIAGLSMIHIFVLHTKGSSNPLGLEGGKIIDFLPSFAIKDLKVTIITLILLTFLLCLHPNELGHPDNVIPANGMSTPEHIVPE